MGFLAPWFLGGALLLGLPIWLHLLRQQTSTPKLFSSLMFFEQSTQSSIKHRRLRYLLLLFLRLALLLLLALAFANPFLNRDVSATAGRKLLVVAMDDSLSMGAAGRLERAKTEAAAVIAGMRPGDTGQVLAASTPVKFLTQVTEDQQELRAAVQSLKAGDGKSSFGDLSRTLRSMAQSSKLPLEVHLVSDMQKSALPAGFADLGLPEGVTLKLHPVQSAETPNWAVESAVAPASIADPKRVRIQVVVAGHSTKEAQRTVSLAVNNKVVASKPVTVPAGGRGSVEFTTLDVPYGFSRCEARIDSADALPADDHFLFAVERADPRRILFVHEGRENRSLLYFRSALAAAAESVFTLEAVTTEQAPAVQPSRFAFVLLSDVSTLPTAFEEELRKYVRAGGAVLVAAGPGTGRRQRVPVLDEPILESRFFSRTSE
ncbi:MAG: BatA domain-containing protein, partial [Bryobacteraceae bacterium]